MATSRGQMPVACKLTTAPIMPIEPDEQCRNIGKTCYMGVTRSQSLFNFSGLAVDCVKETLDKVFFRYSNCDSKDEKVSLIGLNPFSTFQESLKISIRAALILYIMFYAVNMILTKEYGNLDKIASFIMKLILVSYFAVGIGPIYFKDGKETTNNGMMEYGLPLLTRFAPQFAQIIFNSGGNKGLCEFDIKKYKDGYSFYQLWDAVDCRIGYYLGMGLMYNTADILKGIPSSIVGENKGTEVNFPTMTDEAPDTLKQVGSLRFFTVMFGFLLSGNILIVLAGLIFSIIFISIILYFLTNYLVCLVTIYVMTYISPIFIPMALFKKTKPYFDSWLKISVSCALQPAVIAGFIALLLGMYDSAIYKNCEFTRHEYVYNSDVQFSNFELRLPNNNPEECQSSFGYKLLQYYSGIGWEKHSLILFSVKSITMDILSLLADLLYVLVFSIIFYYFSKYIGEFAAELTNGPTMNAVTSLPTQMLDIVKKGASFVKNSSEALSGKSSKEEGAKDSASGGSTQSRDIMSGGGSGEAKDIVSSGGSGKGSE
jgi:type IV secretion system protein VirB6